uniref:Uncharacterized protein LOC104234500 n=1 Tax=Nicotiana sylvestris TaxID=4096 RepID=A0A1U7X2J2_NICSY|nr:PREDICTED: uncharacterized protein LOC104234500 [Nicotiana sylvestris]
MVSTSVSPHAQPARGGVKLLKVEEGREHGQFGIFIDSREASSHGCLGLANQFVRLDVSESSRVLAYVVGESSLLECMKARQFDYPHLLVLKDTMQRGGAKEVVIGDDGFMRIQGWIYVLNIDGLRYFILEEDHSSRYSIHLGLTKMYHDLKQPY